MSAKKLDGMDRQIIEEYESGDCYRIIAERYGVSLSKIYTIMKKGGDTVRPQHISKRKYTFNEHFFDQIDTPIKAYYFGWFVADGYNNENSKISLVLNDLEIIEHLKKTLETDRPIYHHPEGKKHELSFMSRHTCRVLANKGCGNNKSLTMDDTCFDHVPPHLYAAFCLGYFEGDGCVFKRKSCNKWYVNVHLLGTEKFLQRYANVMQGKASYIAKRSGNEIYYLQISSQIETFKFRDWLYADAPFFLRRKKHRFYTEPELWTEHHKNYKG